jgi:hypothetical protein
MNNQRSIGNPEIEFRPEDHTYTHLATRRQVPSVTTILKVMGTYKGIDPEVLNYAAMRGTLAHRACELYDMEDLDIERLDQRLPVTSMGGLNSESARVL